jgi:ribosomal protein S30
MARRPLNEQEKKEAIEEEKRKAKEEAEKIAGEQRRKEIERAENERKAKEEVEKARQEAEAEGRRIEKMKRYKSFLKENGYVDDGNFKLVKTETEIILFKKIRNHDRR